MTDHGPAPRPCVSCPYRRDVPSGVWHPDEYAKLPAYDAATPFQPPGVFMCHQVDGRVCAGWAGCHDGRELLALRLAVVLGTLTPDEVGETIDYVSPVPLFGSGAEAAEHGMAEVDAPDEPAVAVMERITRKREARENADV